MSQFADPRCMPSVFRVVASSLLGVFVSLLCATHTSAVAAATTPGVSASDLSSQQIKDTANRVMQQKDFRGVRRRVLENVKSDTGGRGFLLDSIAKMGTAVGDFFEWIINGIFNGGSKKPRARAMPRPPTATSSSSSASSGGGSFYFSLGKLLLFVGLTVLVLVAIWLVASLLKKSDPNRKLDRSGLFGDEKAISNLSAPPGELAVSTYESRAISMAASGDYRLAIRELLIGSMSWVERAGLIRFRKGLTNRDYIRAVLRQEEQRTAYGRTALEFERVYFGRRVATAEMFDRCLESFQGSFREEEATATTV